MYLKKYFDSFYEELTNLVSSVEDPYLSSLRREGLDASSTSCSMNYTLFWKVVKRFLLVPLGSVLDFSFPTHQVRSIMSQSKRIVKCVLLEDFKFLPLNHFGKYDIV